MCDNGNQALLINIGLVGHIIRELSISHTDYHFLKILILISISIIFEISILIKPFLKILMLKRKMLKKGKN